MSSSVYWGPHDPFGQGPVFPLVAALVAAAALLFMPVARQPQPQPPPVAQVWPAARHGTVPARLPDGSAYEPELFFNTKTSIGSAPSRDGKYSRLVIRRADGAIQELRRLPLARHPSFEAFTATSTIVVWAESMRDGEALWAADLPSGRSVRRLTADTGDMSFYQSQYDLVIARSRVHWVAAAAAGRTEVRSVPLTGGSVDVRSLPGTWALTAWPWLVDGQASLSGADLLHDIMTGREQTGAGAGVESAR